MHVKALGSSIVSIVKSKAFDWLGVINDLATASWLSQHLANLRLRIPFELPVGAPHWV